ncbi:O-methyltransferase 1, chloroplastic [Oryza brachyantha]|uniref:Leucine carboxyl methyltransferase 1 homolog n=1 Tax=Oryza brachyantha TaxID=4533 RepID=J3MJR9_ORYBR|nr:O-methyltransferase 1, chloroplastic [Oryza brachyantha]
MPVLPWLASPAAAAAVRRAPPLSSSPPTLLPLPASSFSPWSWSNRAKGVLPPRGPFATAADTPLGGPLREPDEEGDPLLVAALRAARVRDEESRRPDPLFIDPYAAVLLSIGAPSEDKDSLALHLMPYAEYYRVVTRYIDDKLQHLISNSDDLRQIVLLTDGMDTRPYRLSWPKLSVVYDVSPGRVFSTALQKLRGAGAKISRNCVVLHTLAESPDLQEGLYKNGLNGNRPSLWVLQGLPLFNFKSLEDLLLIISNLAMKGSIFIGELPRFAQWRPAADMASEQDKLENLFFTQGFRVSFVQYDEMVKDVGLGLGSLSEIHGTTLFIAEQLRFSDAQMESFRMHFERIEEDADEDGFEEL